MVDLIGVNVAENRVTDISRRPLPVWGILLMIVTILISFSLIRPARANAAPPLDAPPPTDYSTLSEWKSVDTGTTVISVAFSPDDSMVAGGLNGKIEIYNDKLELIKELVASENKKASSGIQPLGASSTNHSWMMRLAFSPDSKLIAAACYDGTVRIWDIKTGVETICKDPKLSPDEWTTRSHKGSVRSIAFSPDGAKIVSGGDDKAVKLWEVKSGKLLWNAEEHIFPVAAVAFSVDGSSISSVGAKGTPVIVTGKRRGGIGEFKLWDVNTGQSKQSLTVDGFSSKGAVISLDGKVAMCDRTGFWDFKTGVNRNSPAFGERRLDSINTFSPDNKIAVLAFPLMNGNSIIQVLSVQNGQLLIHKNPYNDGYLPHITIPAHVFSIAVSKDNRSFAFGCEDGTIQIWSLP